jgi:PilZ domain
MLSTVSSIQTDRRIKIRYPIQLAVSYRMLSRSQTLSGVGHTLNMSSGGLLLDCRHSLRRQHALSAGMRIEVSMDWPSLLNADIPLQLVTAGRIVRWEGTTCGIAFTKYQFRTKRKAWPALNAS